jgi:hypothetical protein
MFKGKTRLLAIAMVANLACIACKPHNPLWPAEPVTAHASTRTASSDAPADGNLAALPDFSQLAATCGNAVVNVTVIERQHAIARIPAGQDEAARPRGLGSNAAISCLP